MTKNELREIINLHKKWLNGGNGECADLSGANLSCSNMRDANLSRANMSCANLIGANLIGANLSRSNMRDAKLSRANMSCANLIGANLIDANLISANLSCADMSGADLSGADMSGADLSGANLSGADMSCADMSGANLSGADMSGANLSRSNMRDANLSRANMSCANMIELVHNEGTAFYALQCPESGSFIGYKKANDHIVKLEILADAKRSSATSRKCRCSAAKVLSITTVDGSAEVEEIASDRDSNFIYRVGEVVRVDSFDEDRWNECSTGIHFFITRSEAEQYR